MEIRIFSEFTKFKVLSLVKLEANANVSGELKDQVPEDTLAICNTQKGDPFIVHGRGTDIKETRKQPPMTSASYQALAASAEKGIAALNLLQPEEVT